LGCFDGTVLGLLVVVAEEGLGGGFDLGEVAGELSWLFGFFGR
jgi:uncharacterized membrane protein required for colicin V production